MCIVLCASCICIVLMGTNVCSPVCFLCLCRVGGNQCVSSCFSWGLGECVFVKNRAGVKYLVLNGKKYTTCRLSVLQMSQISN